MFNRCMKKHQKFNATFSSNVISSNTMTRTTTTTIVNTATTMSTTMSTTAAAAAAAAVRGFSAFALNLKKSIVSTTKKSNTAAAAGDSGADNTERTTTQGSNDEDSSMLPMRKSNVKKIKMDAMSAFEALIQHDTDRVKKINFNQTVDLSVQLNLDPRRADQNLRGVVTLPKGTGKRLRIAVFVSNPETAALATQAGASAVGAEDLVELIQNGNVDFDRCIATPDMMSLVSRVARILGPRGLMPNVKLGTVTMDVVKAIEATLDGGQVQYRAEKNGIVHAGIGKINFPVEDLIDNFRAFMIAITDNKPEGAKKGKGSGKYIKSAHFSSTMGPSFSLDVSNIDPNSTNFLRFDQK